MGVWGESPNRCNELTVNNRTERVCGCVVKRSRGEDVAREVTT